MIDQIEVCKRDQHWRNPVRRGVESQRVILTAGSVPSSRLFRVNSTLFGLGSGVWTRDVSKTHRLAKGTRAGSVWVNCYQAMDPAVPLAPSSGRVIARKPPSWHPGSKSLA